MSVLVDSSGKASAGSTTTFPNNVAGFAIPDTNLLYVSSDTPQGAGIVNGYSFNATTGAATQVSSTQVQDNSFVAADPSGKFLYVVVLNGPVGRNNAFVPAIATYNINSSTGALTALPQGPQSLIGGPLGDIAVTPNDVWVCADGVDSSSPATTDVICAGRQADGSLANLNTAGFIFPIKGLTGNGQIAFSQDSQWVFAVGGDGPLEEGSMKNPTNPAITVGKGPCTGVAVDPSGKWLVVAESTNALQVYSIGANGQLTAGSTMTLPAPPGQIAFSKAGILFVPNDSGTAAFSFDAAKGTLTALNGSSVPGAKSTTNSNATPVATQ